jgi:outer membrane autotransporter protein
VIVGGTTSLAPGLGDLGTLSGDHFTLQGTPTLLFNLSSSNNTSDRLSLTGAFDGVGGPFQFDFGGGGLAGQTYTLAQFGSTTFNASNFTAANLGPGLSGTFQVTPTELRVAVVPEPVTALSLLGAMAMLSGCRRRQR